MATAVSTIARLETLRSKAVSTFTRPGNAVTPFRGQVGDLRQDGPVRVARRFQGMEEVVPGHRSQEDGTKEHQPHHDGYDDGGAQGESSHAADPKWLLRPDEAPAKVGHSVRRPVLAALGEELVVDRGPTSGSVIGFGARSGSRRIGQATTARYCYPCCNRQRSPTRNMARHDAQIGRSSSAYETDRRRSTPSLVIVY